MSFGYEGGFGYMWIFPLLFLAVFFFFMRSIFGGGSPRAETPREVLDRRFAAGEISKEQYEEMKAALAK